MGGDKQGWGDGDSCDSSTHLSACVRMLRSLSRSGESPGGWGSWKGREGMVRAGTPNPITPRPPFSPPTFCHGSEDPTQSCAHLPSPHRPPCGHKDPPKNPPPPPRADTHRLTVCWMTFIQLLRSSREAAWTSYISGGAALIRNIPFSWLAISRTIRFCREMTAGLSCKIGDGVGTLSRCRCSCPSCGGGPGCGGGVGGVSSPAWGRCISGPSLAGR